MSIIHEGFVVGQNIGFFFFGQLPKFYDLEFYFLDFRFFYLQKKNPNQIKILLL